MTLISIRPAFNVSRSSIIRGTGRGEVKKNIKSREGDGRIARIDEWKDEEQVYLNFSIPFPRSRRGLAMGSSLFVDALIPRTYFLPSVLI